MAFPKGRPGNKNGGRKKAEIELKLFEAKIREKVTNELLADTAKNLVLTAMEKCPNWKTAKEIALPIVLKEFAEKSPAPTIYIDNRTQVVHTEQAKQLKEEYEEKMRTLLFNEDYIEAEYEQK